MKLTPTQVEKANEPLRDALLAANEDEDEELVVIFGLMDAPTTFPPPPPFASFASRAEWRKAISKINVAHILNAVGGTLEALRELGLEPKCWALGLALVYGRASLIAKALELPGIKDGVLDFDLPLIEEIPPEELRENE